MNEAQAGWLLKQAREAESTHRQSERAQRVLPILLIGIALILGVLLLAFATPHPASASTPNTRPIAGTWYGNMNFSVGHSVQRVHINPQFTAEGILKQRPNASQ